MPLPVRARTRPRCSNELIASRTTERLTPKVLASSRSEGSRSPGWSPRSTTSCSIHAQGGRSATRLRWSPHAEWRAARPGMRPQRATSPSWSPRVHADGDIGMSGLTNPTECDAAVKRFQREIPGMKEEAPRDRRHHANARDRLGDPGGTTLQRAVRARRNPGAACASRSSSPAPPRRGPRCWRSAERMGTNMSGPDLDAGGLVPRETPGRGPDHALGGLAADGRCRRTRASPLRAVTLPRPAPRPDRRPSIYG